MGGAIARASGLARNKVDKYLRLAAAAEITQGGEPPGEGVLRSLIRQSQPGPRPGSIEAPRREALRGQRERIASWLTDGRLQLTRIHELLRADGIAVSYTTLREWLGEEGLRGSAKTTVRMAEWPSGEVAEMDFGRLRTLVDGTTGKKQTIWALVVVLPYSRRQFVWPLLRH